MIELIHKQAILKLINCFINTPTSIVGGDEYVTRNTSNSTDDEDDYEPLCKFKEPIVTIDLPVLSRLGWIIAKFEKIFKPSKIMSPSFFPDQKHPFGQDSLQFPKQIKTIVNYIVVNEILHVNQDYTHGFLNQLQGNTHLQALILLIREWLCQFYQTKEFIVGLFPLAEGGTFSLVDLKENNLCVLSLLLFNVFYTLRESFPEYKLLLDFSWILFGALDFSQIQLNKDYIYSLLQNSLLCVRVDDEKEKQINSELYKQIETLRNKIVDTKKRIQTLTMSKSNPTKSTNNTDQLMRITTTPRSTATSSNSTSVKGATKSGLNSQTEKPFKCHLCMKTFPTSYKLNRHCYSHSGERPYMCTWPSCLKRFNDNYHLRRHMNTHTGEKPFPCKYHGCSKRYSRSEDLRNHQKTHYPNSGENVPNSNGRNTSNNTNNNNSNNNNHDGVTLHHDSPLQLLVQSTSNSLASPVTFSLSTAITPITVSKAAVRLATATASDTNQNDSLQSQLNQLQQQLQLQSQQQQQQQLATFTSTLSPGQVIGDDSTLQPAIIQLQDVGNANSSQNHVVTTLHINENYF